MGRLSHEKTCIENINKEDRLDRGDRPLARLACASPRIPRLGGFDADADLHRDADRNRLSGTVAGCYGLRLTLPDGRVASPDGTRPAGSHFDGAEP